jgi:hypothetical protein
MQHLTCSTQLANQSSAQQVHAPCAALCQACLQDKRDAPWWAATLDVIDSQ